MSTKDTRDEWSDAIDAAFPTRSGAHQEYATAMGMVHNRHSKGALVALVCWLLVERKLANARANELQRQLEAPLEVDLHSYR